MKDKMSTLFTSDELIDHCLESNFLNNSIKHLKHIHTFHLVPNESVVSIQEKNINIIQQHKDQDNLRLNFLIEILKYAVANIDNLNCKIIFNICDGARSTEKYTRLCFSASSYSNHIQIPDPHIFKYFNFVDNISCEDKIEKIIFVGSDTGPLGQDLLNERIRFCKYTNKIKHIYAKISNFVHFNKNMLQDLDIDMESISSAYISIHDQLQYKYILNIYGNTASWDRIPWGMMSNSYLINLESDYNEHNWYYPFIKKHQAIDSYKLYDLATNKRFYNQEKKDLQKNIAKIILEQNTHLKYFIRTLITYNRIYNS